MPGRQAFRVYLAGPISRCNDTQMRRWRETVKGEYGSKMTFLDPVERLVDPEASPYEFVEADLQHIMEADGLLVNMWRESIGAAMGVAHAHRHGRAIVVSDPNHLENKRAETDRERRRFSAHGSGADLVRQQGPRNDLGWQRPRTSLANPCPRVFVLCPKRRIGEEVVP